MDDLGTRQLRLIERSHAFLAAQARRGVDVAIAPECYLNGWARVPGNARLRYLGGGWGGTAALLAARIKDALNVARHSEYEIVGGGASLARFERLVISWSRRSDFAGDGSYVDRYFHASSRETPNTLWLLIAVDQAAPERLEPNVRVFRRRPGTPGFDFLHLVRCAAAALRPSKPGVDGSVPALSAAVSLARQLVAVVVALLDADSVSSVVLPYEAQPFQHAVFRAVKRHDRSIATVGYLHSALPPLPTDLIHRVGAPELLLVHGQGQAEILTSRLGWPRSALRTIPSLRYRVTDPGPLGGLVLLPYAFGDARVIEAAFRDFLLSATRGTLPPLSVRNHPMMQESKPHRRLQRRLEAEMRAHSDRFAGGPRAQPVSVFIGATAAILEALERGVAVVHICSQPLMESHGAQVWEGLEVERIGEHVFRYRLPVRGTYIEFGAETDTFERYLGPELGTHHGRKCG